MNKYQEAFKEVKEHIKSRCHWWSKQDEDKHLKTLQELVDKETPMKVPNRGTVIQCPKCFTIFPYVTGPLGPCVTSTEYCPDCGQRLDWSD